MLKQENIEKYDSQVRLAIDELWMMASKNQKSENDLVLIIANGSKNNYSAEILRRHKTTNYQIGHDLVHFRYITFYDFIDQYKKVFDEEEYGGYENKTLWDETMVQMQLLSYLKFWETDLILKRLYNLSLLAQGKEYLWDIQQKELNDRRRLVKDEIQEPIKDICPKFYDFIDNVYSRQLRNAIAHSQYYIMHSTIHLTNRDESKFYKLNSISFVRWEEIFTKIILMHNYLIDNFNRYSSYYADKVQNKHNGLLVYFPDLDVYGLNKSAWIKFDEERRQWFWNDNAQS